MLCCDILGPRCGLSLYESLRLQTQILATHGAKGFFKGLSTPLVTVAAFNAVLFASRGSMERLLAHPDGECKCLKRTHDDGSAHHSV